MTERITLVLEDNLQGEEEEEGFSVGGLIPRLLRRGRRPDGSWYSVVRLSNGDTATFTGIDGKSAEINPWNSREK